MQRLLALALLLALTAAGCKTTAWNEEPPAEDETPLESVDSGGNPANAFSNDPAPVAASSTAATATAAGGTRLTDVPVPADATEDMERTYVYEAAGLQVGRMVYKVKGTVNETAQFYIDQCKALGWGLESVLQADSTNLLFRKPGRRLDVTVQPQSIRTGNLLTVTLTPDGGGELK